MVGVLCAVVVVLVVGSGSASAAYTHAYLSSFGSSLGSFGHVASIAIDQSTGDVYVYDVGVTGGSIFKFDSEGKPVNFSSTGTNAISNVGEEQITAFDQIAVDGDPSSPAYGDIYVARGESSETLDIYSASGQKVGALTKEVETEVPASKGTWFQACGVAVDAQGNVYVALRTRTINKYTPSGTYPSPVVNTDYVGSLWGLPKRPCAGLAVDSVGNVFDGAIEVFSPSQFNTTKAPAGGSLVYPGAESEVAVDPATDEPYSTGEVEQFIPGVLQFGPHGEPFGTPKGTFGSVGEGAINGGASGIAVNGGSGDVYVSDGAGHVNVFGPTILVPDVTIEPASNIDTTKATVSGTVNPDEVEVTSCVFEYGVGGKYEHSIVCPTAPGSGSSAVPETVELAGLTPTTGYEVRLTARNAQGENLAGESFTTATPPGPPSVSRVEADRYSMTKTSANLSGSIDPTGLDTTYHYEYGPTVAYGTSVPVPDADIGSGFSSVGVPVSLTGLVPGEYHIRLVASNSAGTTYGPDTLFKTVPLAAIQTETVTSVGVEEVTLQSSIAPLGDDTTYRFEYGPTNVYGSTVPVPDGDLGSGSFGEWGPGSGRFGAVSQLHEPVTQLIRGLQPDTTYHYRVVATNILGSVTGEDRTFTTMPTPSPAPADTCPNASRRVGGLSEALPDCRAYEMVSPLDKNGSNIGANLYFSSKAAADGQRVSFLANSGFADTVGSEIVGFTSYVASREAGGWSTHSVTPPAVTGKIQDGLGAGNSHPATQEQAFTDSLSQAIFKGAGLFGADPGTGSLNMYMEDTGSRAVETVTLDRLHCECSSVEAMELHSALVGYSSDAGVVVFQSTLSLLPGTLGEKMRLYEWDHGTLRLAGILPDGSIPSSGSFGPGFYVFGANYSPGSVVNNNSSVSSDGSRVLFASPSDGSAPPQLYMRKNGSSTVWLSRSWTTVPTAEPVGVHFQAASADDTKVLFTSKTRLLNSDTGEGDTGIYLYTDTSENPENEGKLALIGRVNVRESGIVAGMSEDATHVYFYNSVPTSSIPREGEYLWDKGTLHFVAGMRAGIGSSNSFIHTFAEGTSSRVSSDGRRLAFLYSPDPEGEPELATPTSQQNNSHGHAAMYVYDEGSGKVTCASCPPDGAAVTADVEVASSLAKLSAAGAGGEPFLQRYFSSDGRFVFFTTVQSLLPGDTNGLPDVYEYDVDKGELRLVSSGTGETGSWFEDASASGSDVFFLTAQKLTGWDTGTLTDLYDARVNGGFAEPVPPPVSCDGDACQGVPGAVPSFNTASGFTGLGNQRPTAVVVKKKVKPKKHSKRRRGKKRLKGHAGKRQRSRVRKSSRVGR
jgi:hypothetical protein